MDVFQNSETIKKQLREENIPKELNDPKILKQKISNIQSKIDRRRNNTVELEERRTELYENYLSLKINKDTLDRLMESSNQSNLKVLEEIKQLESEILILKGGIEWEEWFEDFEVYISKIKSYTSLEQKRKFIESIIEKIIVSWDNVTNTHNLKIKFRLHIVKDKGKLIGNEISDIKKGKKTLIINELDFKKGWRDYKKFLNQKTSYINHSTVTDCVIYDENLYNLFISNTLNELILKFDVSLKSSKLTKTYHYNSQQQRLYDVVKELYEIKGFGYRRISDFLINEGFRTIQSNKPILPNYVYSIYKKGKIRENRINREFDSYYHNIRLFVN